jgi:hypothetical protein
MAGNPTPWSLSGPRFTLACGNLTSESDLRDFVLGLTTLKWAASPLDWWILGPQLPQTVNGQFAVTECYVRGDDFVVSCERPGPVPLVPQFYWRARQIASHAAVSIELILSMRTDLLDSQPETSVETLLRCREVLVALKPKVDAFRSTKPVSLSRADLDAGDVPAFLFRHSGVSYFQMVHPDDFYTVELKLWRKVHPRLRTALFPERLEKGVIRRARICGWFLPVENDLETAVELARQFIDEPLPLTA